MENNTQVSPLAELYLARAMASFRANHYKWNTASYLLINRGQNRSSTNSMTVFYLLSQYELKHVFTLPKAAWLPMVSLPGGWAISVRIALLPSPAAPCPALHIQQLRHSAQQPNGHCCRGTLWQVAPGQPMGGKMGLDAEGEGILAVCGSSGSICSGSTLNCLGGLEQ